MSTTTTINRYSLVAALSALFFALGCTSTPPAPAADPAEKPAPIAKTSDSDRLAIRDLPPTLEPVYFATDDATLTIDARNLLGSYAASLLDHPDWGVITIDGHCDERGSEQYNQALGKRRAAAVERYLVKMEVPRARITTRSFGADRPAARGHDESAWSYNRRSELHIEVLASASR